MQNDRCSDILFLSRYSDKKGVEFVNSYQIQSNHCSLQVYERGNENSRTAILFLHGGPGSGAKAIMELPAFQRLEQQYQCIYFDQRGAGASSYDLSKGLEIDDLIQDVISILDHVKQYKHLDEYILWGGSFGGCLASLCLEKYPTLFDKCMLSSPAITFSREQALAFFQRMQEPYKKRMPITAPLGEETIDTPEEFFANSEIRNFIFGPLNPSTSFKHICAMGGWFYRHPFQDLIKNIQIPTLILQGKDDPICIYQNLDNEIHKYPNTYVDYHLYEGCGHAVFEDKEDEFVEQMIQFINK